MKRLINLIILFSVLVSIIFPQKTIAVLDFDANDVSKSNVRALSDRLREELFRTKKYRVLERGLMEEIMKEQKFQLSGCVSTECIVEVGQLTGVQKMVGGSVSKVGNVYSVSSRIIDVETGEISNMSSYDHTGDMGELLTKGMRIVAIELATGRKPQSLLPQVANTPLTEQIGYLTVKTKPHGVDITIDGERTNMKTPMIDYELSKGRHTIILTSKKFERISQGVMIEPNQTKALDILMTEKQSEVNFTSNPSAAMLNIDGNDKGKTPQTVILTFGKYNIELAKKYYEKTSFTLDVTEDVMEVNKIIIPNLVNVTVLTKPNKARAELYIDGESRGEVKVDGLAIKLKPGKYKFGLEAENYYTREEEITIKPTNYFEKEIKLEKLDGKKQNKKVRKRNIFTTDYGISAGLPGKINVNGRIRYKKLNTELSVGYGFQLALGYGNRNNAINVLIGRNLAATVITTTIDYNYWGVSFKHWWRFTSIVMADASEIFPAIWTDVGYINTGAFYKSPHQLYMQLGLGIEFDPIF